MSNKENKPLMPKLRFSAFKNSPEWTSEKVDRLVDTVTPPKKLPTSSYAVKGDFPIIDQSQNAICGWTDDREALIQDDLPLIIFGDHTCILKLLDRPFAQGADGIKILKPRPRIGTLYLYQYLSYRPVVTEEYKRHYSILKEKVVLFPDFKTGEQQKITDCLSSLDELIAAQARKVGALKAHKKGLMLQLFPRDGETEPRFRFPEFKEDGMWERRHFSDLCDVKHGYAFESEFFSNEGEYVLLTPGNFYEEGGYRDRGELQKYFIGEIPLDYVLTKGNMLVAMTEQAVGLLGSPILVPEFGKFLHNQRLGLVVRKPGIACANDFFFYVFNTEGVRKAIHDTASGAKVRHTSPTKIGEVLISVPPTLPEQQRIASCLSSLDTQITAVTQKLEALKTHKRGLMQQLFPSPEEEK